MRDCSEKSGTLPTTGRCSHARSCYALLAVSGLLLCTVGPVGAHGFGQRFDLPLPLWLWITGAGLTVLLSFSIVVDFLPRSLERLDLSAYAGTRALTHPVTIIALRSFVLGMFVVTIISALWGTTEPTRNLAPTMVWVIWWVGLVMVSALIGDAWALVNPFRSLFSLLDRGAQMLSGRSLSLGLDYPRRAGVWPAVGLMLGFAAAEHLWTGAAVPLNLGYAMLAYTGLTILCMGLFGPDIWLRHGEVFSVAFTLLARFSPVELNVRAEHARPTCPNHGCRSLSSDCVNGYVCLTGVKRSKRRLNLRLPGVGLLNDRPVSVSFMFFTLLVLSGVTFDGFIETPRWEKIADSLAWFGSRTLVESAALLIFPLLFLLGFVLAAFVMKIVARRLTGQPNHKRQLDTLRLAREFVPSLIPIAVAYHLAHYLSLLLSAGQLIIPLGSDPLGLGWDLWGSAGYRVDPELLGIRALWYVVVTSVVIGHMLAVYIAHLIALDVFRDKAVAVRCEAPLLILMVGYTMMSLWILAQPPL